jgi:arylsulfatase A-like enzyme
MPATRRLFVRGGTSYSNAFVTTPMCCPSRASIFTGRYAHNHRVLHDTTKSARALDQESTIQYRLCRSGYRTAIFGKYLNGWPLGEAPPYFDEWATGKTGTYYNARWNVNGKLRTIPEYSTTYIRRRAVRFIRRAAASPRRSWFLYLPVFAPHPYFVAERKYATAKVPKWRPDPAVFEKNKSDKPPYVRRSITTFLEGSTTRVEQLRTLMSVDDLVRRVFAALAHTGQGRDTLAFFVSDNGFMWGQHALYGKTYPYTQSVHVPMMMRWPGHVAAGVRDKRIVANIDIAPTISDATGIAAGPDVAMDGKSLLDAGWTRRAIELEDWGYLRTSRPWASIRSLRYQYTEYYGKRGNIKFREYYNLRSDPAELHNLLHDGKRGNAPNVARLHRLLGRDRTCRGASCP